MSFISSIAIDYVCSCSIRKLHPTFNCNAIGCLPSRKGHLIVQKQRCGDCFSNSSRQGWHCIIWEALCSFLANFQTPTGSPAFRTSSYSHFPLWSIMRRIWSASIVNLISSSQTLPSGTLGCCCLWIALDEMWGALKKVSVNSWWRKGVAGRWMASAYRTSRVQCAYWHLFFNDARCSCQCIAPLRAPHFAEEETEAQMGWLTCPRSLTQK